MRTMRKPVFVLLLTVLLLLLAVGGLAEGQRIISLAPSHTEVLYALGLADDIVGWTQYEDYPPEVAEVPGWVPYGEYAFVSVEDELAKGKAVVGSFTSFNEELIAALEPTLILAVDPLQQGIADDLAQKGYNVLWFNPATLDEVHDMIQAIADATGTSEVAAALVASQRAEIEEIRAISSTLPKVRVYFEIAHEMYGYGPYALGGGSPMDQIVELAGGENVFFDRKELAFALDYADIAATNPDVILTPLWPYAGREEVTTVREIVNRPDFETLNAVLNDRVYHYDSSLLKRPGPRQVTAIRKLAYLLHPYYFDNPPNSVSPWELGKIDANEPPPAPLD